MSDTYEKRPQPGQVWRHHSGRHYTVLFIANDVEVPKDDYPVQVIYIGQNGKVWAGKLSDWHRRMRLENMYVEEC